MDTFGKRLRHLRKTLKLTQVELGEVIGITGAAVAKLEADSGTTTLAAKKLICATYNVSFAWLTEGIGEMWTPRDLDDLVDQYTEGWPEFARAVMRGFVRLPDEEWQKVIDLVEHIKKEGLPR